MEEGYPVIAVAVNPGTIIETNLKRHLTLRGLFEVICKIWMSPAKLYAMIVSEPNKSIKQGKVHECKIT